MESSSVVELATEVVELDFSFVAGIDFGLYYTHQVFILDWDDPMDYYYCLSAV